MHRLTTHERGRQIKTQVNPGTYSAIYTPSRTQALSRSQKVLQTTVLAINPLKSFVDVVWLDLNHMYFSSIKYRAWLNGTQHWARESHHTQRLVHSRPCKFESHSLQPTSNFSMAANYIKVEVHYICVNTSSINIQLAKHC